MTPAASKEPHDLPTEEVPQAPEPDETHLADLDHGWRNLVTILQAYEAHIARKGWDRGRASMSLNFCGSLVWFKLEAGHSYDGIEPLRVSIDPGSHTSIVEVFARAEQWLQDLPVYGEIERKKRIAELERELQDLRNTNGGE